MTTLRDRSMWPYYYFIKSCIRWPIVWFCLYEIGTLAASAHIFWRVNGFRQKAYKSLFPVSLVVKHFPFRYTARRLSTNNSLTDFMLTCRSYRDHAVWSGHEFGTTKEMRSCRPSRPFCISVPGWTKSPGGFLSNPSSQQNLTWGLRMTWKKERLTRS